jgi:hypothetical protein
MNLVGRSFSKCLRNRLLSGCAMRFTTRSFGCILRGALWVKWSLQELQLLVLMLISRSGKPLRNAAGPQRKFVPAVDVPSCLDSIYRPTFLYDTWRIQSCRHMQCLHWYYTNHAEVTVGYILNILCFVTVSLSYRYAYSPCVRSHIVTEPALLVEETGWI